MDLNIDFLIQNELDDLQKIPEKFALAIKRSIRKLIRWIQVRVLRMMAKEDGVKQKTLKRYKRINIRLGDFEGSFWVGSNPLPLHEFGRVFWKKKSVGAEIGGQTFPGSFYRAVFSNEKKVWIRTSRNVKEGHAVFHKRRKLKAFAEEQSKGRFPVELLGRPLTDGEEILDVSFEREAENRFVTIFKQEVNFLLTR